MTYPSQPGYPSPYGQPPPGGRQQNNLWLIGGSIVLVLVIVMTVILLVVQQTQSDDSADGGGDNGGDSDNGGDDGGGDEGGDDHGDLGSVEINADACAAFDLSAFESNYGSYSPDETSTSSSNSGGNPSVSCTFYNEDYTSVYLYVTDWDSASDVADYVGSDADYYNEENGYTYSEYTDYGDAGSMYTTDYGESTATTLHVALGSLDVTVSTTLYDNESITAESGLAVLEDFVQQADVLFADYK